MTVLRLEFKLILFIAVSIVMIHTKENVIIMSKLLLHIILITGLAYTQKNYPADTVLASPQVSIFEKSAILPISGWQRISYNSELLACQFYPSCSNYGALAIRDYGPIIGLAITADRIVRCNPFALNYHYEMHGEFQYPDYRLVDSVQVSRPRYASNKSPLAAAGLSTIIPGTGRIYAGRFLDGLMGLWMVLLPGTAAYGSFQDSQSMKGNFFAGITLIFWIGEIYGAYRTAKYYHRPKKDG